MTLEKLFWKVFGPREMLVVMIALLAAGRCLAERPDIKPQLLAGKLADAEQALQAYLKNGGDDDQARFQLGTVQVLRAVEQLSQDGVRYGALNRTMMIPFFRVGGFSAGKGEPQPVTYGDVRAMIERFQSGINTAEATLAAVDDEQLAWKLNFKEVSLDLDGDGKLAQAENLEVLFRLAGNRSQPPGGPDGLPVGFDAADVYWLRGYCHLLSALADSILAYDHQRLFDNTAHAFFANPQTEFARLQKKDRAPGQNGLAGWEDIADVIAAIHLMEFKLREPERLEHAQQHLLRMVEMSRRSWELVVAETDDDHEWIPNANQQSVIEGLAMTQERIDTWHNFLAEAEDVIRGKKLIPFWRSGFDQGVNLGKAFTEPRSFDLVLWVQGTAALPYLEDGEKSSPETWLQFQRVFRGEFIGFAAWIN
jgi:hypothetical protein